MTPEQFAVGDTIAFAPPHQAAGDTGVIVGEECWTDKNTPVVWDGTGDRPEFYGGVDLCYGHPRYLVRLLAFGRPQEEVLESVRSWRARCLKSPHDYPYATPADMVLVSRPEIDVLNESGCAWSVMARDGDLACAGCSPGTARLRMAWEKASRGLTMTPARKSAASVDISFTAETETKIADDIELGFRYCAHGLCGLSVAVVDHIHLKTGTAFARLTNGLSSTVAYLGRKRDGWYDLHMHANPEAFMKVKFED